jgi:hypothetical protein
MVQWKRGFLETWLEGTTVGLAPVGQGAEE